MRRALSTNRIEGHGCRPAREPPIPTEWRKDARRRRDLLCSRRRCLNLGGNQAALPKQRVIMLSHRDKAGGVRTQWEKEKPTILQRFSPTRLAVGARLKLNLGNQGAPRSKVLLLCRRALHPR